MGYQQFLYLQNQIHGFILHGMKRIYSQLMNEYLQQFPCIAVIGARQAGKTTMVRMLPDEWRYFDLERISDFDQVSRDPELFLRLHPDRTVIDEAQMLPELFPALRVAIDDDRTRKGRFVITGSSSPTLQRNVAESLAGRVAVVEMSPLLWAEAAGGQAVSPVVHRLTSFRSRMKTRELIDGLQPRGTVREAHDYWFRGGYPEPWLAGNERFYRRWTDQYVESYLNRDIARLFPNLNQVRFRQFLGMMSGLSGEVLNYAEVARNLQVSQPTARDYFEIAHGTFLWRRLPAYDRNVRKRVVKHPKGYMRDSGLLHRLLRIPDLDALLSHPRCGRSWEGMVVEELLRQFNALGEPVQAYHYRTSGGAEIDLVLEGDFGLLPIEVKYGQKVEARALRVVREFIDEHDCALGIVASNEREPRLYDEKIIGIPFVYL